jgi:hypothetical protein
MKTVIDSTDKKHIGEVVDETLDVIVFANGEEMIVEKRLYNNTVLSNSNYVLFLSSEE